MTPAQRDALSFLFWHDPAPLSARTGDALASMGYATRTGGDAIASDGKRRPVFRLTPRGNDVAAGLVFGEEVSR